MDSILTSIKKLLGIAEEYTQFDSDIIMHINSTFMILTQMGVGPANGFMIEDDISTWSEFLGEDTNLEAVKSYVYLRVKLLFDPPSGGSVADSMKRMIDEFEWRLNVTAESKETEKEVE